MNQSSVFIQFQLDTTSVSLRMTHFHHIWLVKVVDYSRYYWDFLQETIHTSPHQQRPHTWERISVLESFSWEECVTFLFILRDIPQSICTIFDSYFDKQVFVFWMNVLLLRPLGITELSSSMIISKNVDFELSSLTINRPGGKLSTGWFFPELC